MKKLLVRNSLVVLAAGVVVALVLAGVQTERKLAGEAERGLRNLATVLASNLDYTDDPQDEINDLSREAGGLRITLASSEGQVLADSVPTPKREENFLDSPEVRQAMQEGTGCAERKTTPGGQRMLLVAVRMEDGGILRVGQPYYGLARHLLWLSPGLFLALLAALAAALPLAYWRAGAQVKARAAFLENLAQAMQRGEVAEAPPAYKEYAGLLEQVRGLQAARQEQRWAQSVFKGMGEGFVLLDDGNHLLMVNQAAAEILDCPAGGLESSANQLALTRHPVLLKAVERVRETGRPCQRLFETPQGEFEAMLTRVVVDSDSETPEKAVSLLIRDVSAQRREADARQQFFSLSTHELRDPITAIHGFAELLGDSAMDTKQQQACAQRILREAKRMDQLTRDILFLSRLENREAQFTRQPVDLLEVLQECSRDLLLPAKEAGVEIQLEGEPLVLQASRKELYELAWNLISNAVQYNQADGVVEIKLAQQDERPVLSVFNTGEAIPENKTERIFERFYRLNKSRSKAAGGTGLGLTIVRMVAGRYDARVLVQPQPGKGNTFIVEFPPRQPAPPCGEKAV